MNKTKIFPNFWQALLYNYIFPILIGLAILFPIVLIFYGGILPDWLVKFNAYFGHIVTIPILLFFLWKSKIKISWSEFTNFNVRKVLIVVLLAIFFEFIFFGTMYLFEKIFNRNYNLSPSNSPIHLLSVIHSLFMAPIIEEILYRRIFLHQFLNQYSLWVALILSSFLFAIPHISVMKHFELLIPYLLSGLFLGIVYYKTRSISLCIISHFIMNLTVSLLNYFAKF